MNKTDYNPEEASKYAHISLRGEGTIFLAFRDLEAIIRSHFPTAPFESLHAIDYGCGTSRSTRYLKSLGISQVDGFDVSEEMIQEAKKLDPSGNYTKISSGMVPVSDSVYDLALMSFVTVAIDTKDELAAIFKEIRRTLKKGGQFLCLTLSENFWDPKWQWLTYKQDYPENYTPVSGQKSRLTITSVNLELTDCYWLDKDIIDCATKAGLSLNQLYYPLGKMEDGIVWQDETTCAPYTIFSFTK